MHSDHLDKRKLNGFNLQLKKHKAALEKSAEKLMKLNFACEADAKDALNRFLKEHKNDFYPLQGGVEKTSEKAKRKKPGRPAKDEKPEYQTLYKAHVQLGEEPLA